ncbi:hypothetical protein SLEP1_g48005 [Rubroshorea leprosula]|uniref:Uncharacterized protein n=1 Tax=Rubroshorea leprosula TaxID=152421 RepID=A0AAV5LT46_9ROSI|nr:hypothetical protein SLEP1_g48005 [Rubroshorea leprosula]
MYLTSADCIETAELYGPSAFSEAKMDKFLNAVGGVAIPKKLRKKSKTSTKEVNEVEAGKELAPSTSAGVEEVRPRLELKRKGNEEVAALQRKKKVVEQEVRGSEVLQFVPWPPFVELDLELKESEAEGAEVRALVKGKGLIAPLSFKSNMFDAKNATGARRFINATFPEVDKCQARDKAMRYCGATVVKHALESVSWVNGLAQEFMESVKECSLLQRQKNVKTEYPEVDITKVTFDEQEERVQENSESMSTDFHLQIKLRWDHDAEGRTVLPPNFDFEFVAMEEEKAEVEGAEVGAKVEGAEVEES